jgi:hypothetical protein
LLQGHDNTLLTLTVLVQLPLAHLPISEVP